ncbi:MAG: response regulator transcription factor [Cyclobacteriaceae bacterium]|nr:response regulator transcription factor [Cyclobacteriaceae bacterium]
MEVIKTILVDDHILFCEGLERLLTESNQFNILKKFHNGKNLLEYLTTETPDLVILDIEMPGLNGLDVVKRITLSKPSVKVVLLSMHDENIYAREALAQGACGFLNKSMDSLLLIESLLQVSQGKKVFPIISQHAQPDSPLSEREIMILKLVSRGLTNESISQELKISPLTVKSHRKNMIQKLKAKNSAELLMKAFERGLI